MGDPALLVDNAYWLAMRAHPARHNTAILIGKLFLLLPGYNPARALNLASVFTGATAILLYGILLLRVCRSKLVALSCTGILMVSHSMWWHSTIAESYAVNAAFVVGALWLLFAPGPLRDWRLVLLFLVGALALFNHFQLGIILVGATVGLLVAMVSRLRERGQPPAGAIQKVRGIVALGATCTLACVIGLIPWLIVLRQDVLRFGWARTMFRLRGAKWRQLMFEGDASEGLTNALYLVFEQFPGPFLLAVPLGLVILARRYEVKKSLGFFAMLALNTGFFALYNTWDRYAFLLPTFIMFTFAGALAVDTLWGRLQGGGARRSARAVCSSRLGTIHGSRHGAPSRDSGAGATVARITATSSTSPSTSPIRTSATGTTPRNTRTCCSRPCRKAPSTSTTTRVLTSQSSTSADTFTSGWI
jgi:hypothetical protein